MKLIPLSAAIVALQKLPNQQRLIEFSFTADVALVLTIHADFDEVLEAYAGQLTEDVKQGESA